MGKQILKCAIVGITFSAFIASAFSSFASAFVILIAVFNLSAKKFIVGFAIETASCIAADASWKALAWMADKEKEKCLKVN